MQLQVAATERTRWNTKEHAASPHCSAAFVPWFHWCLLSLNLFGWTHVHFVFELLTALLPSFRKSRSQCITTVTGKALNEFQHKFQRCFFFIFVVFFFFWFCGRTLFDRVICSSIWEKKHIFLWQLDLCTSGHPFRFKVLFFCLWPSQQRILLSELWWYCKVDLKLWIICKLHLKLEQLGRFIWLWTWNLWNHFYLKSART